MPMSAYTWVRGCNGVRAITCGVYWRSWDTHNVLLPNNGMCYEVRWRLIHGSYPVVITLLQRSSCRALLCDVLDKETHTLHNRRQH